MMQYNFQDPETNLSDLMTVYSTNDIARDTLYWEDGGLRNPDTEDFIALLPDQKFETGTVISTECSFSGLGAPMIVIGKKLLSEDGHTYFDERFEFVVFPKGCNIWFVINDGSLSTHRLKSTKLFHYEKALADGEKISLSVKTDEGRVSITLNGDTFDCEIPGLPKTFYAGIMACEGPCKFYSMSIRSRV